MPFQEPAAVSVGEYSRTEAFAAVRSLEHAGITAEIRGGDDI